MSKFLKKLNPQQKEAATSIDGKIRVAAGAGSGKTKALVARYCYLISEVGIHPQNILCLTFTNKAAKEMSDRVKKILGGAAECPYISTIHSFCVKVLRGDIHRIGYPLAFNITDAEDSKDIATRILDELDIDKENMTAGALIAKVGEYKSDMKYIEGMLINNNSNESRDPVIKYIQYQRDNYYIDFDDIIYIALYLLEKYKSVKEKWDFFDYVMLDEAQDCNKTDFKIISILSERTGNLFMVGDQSQCIYEWRGSYPKLFTDFKADKTITLEKNYRSTKHILDAANSIIKNNKNRIELNLYTEGDEGTKIDCYHAKSDADEAYWIAKTIQGLHKDEERPYSDFTILYRASYLSRSIEQALMKKNLPYIVYGGIRFYDRKEIKDALAYLKVIANSDNLAFERIINTPARKFGKQTLAVLRELAKEENTNLYDALKKHIKDKVFYKPLFIKFVANIEEARKISKGNSISETLKAILKLSGLRKMYETDPEQERVENLNELIASIKVFETDKNHADEEVTIDAYLQEIALYTELDRKKDDKCIKLMTVHQSKGLEFPVVFIMGVNEDIFPNARTIRERMLDGVEEERRLMYVAVTRAKEKVFITESEGFSYASQGNKEPSRFIEEIDNKDISHIYQPKYQKEEKTPKWSTYNKNNAWKKFSIDQSNKKFSVGDRVKHKFFGEGEVVKANYSNNTYTVSFNGNERVLIAGMLTKI
jgi:DNA helicase-2/ATP-dependent DNA helicase PcrA